ncbi:MAG: exosome complex RNA-binding protein Rrp4 [Candidatus Hadarchaeales archaeon]
MICVQNRELVVPGQLLAEGELRAGKGAYREGKRIYSSVVGLARVGEKEVGVIALEGCYEPTVGDDVIGVVTDRHPHGWIIDLNSPYEGNLFAWDLLGKVDVFRVDLSSHLAIGDLLFARVTEVTPMRRVGLEARGPGYGKLRGGWLVEITPVKIPRVIGRHRSMISMIQSVTGCTLRVGQNGRIVILGPQEKVAPLVEAIRMIEREAHTGGLTDRVKAFLEKKLHAGEETHSRREEAGR